MNLCHTTGITCDSEPVVIKISLVRLIHCGVCKANLGTSQLKALHEVTHGLGKLLSNLFSNQVKIYNSNIHTFFHQLLSSLLLCSHSQNVCETR